MIPSYLVEPLVKNYTAPKYPLFIALQNALASINNKKSLRDPRHDIESVPRFIMLVRGEDRARGLKIRAHLAI